MNKIFVALLGLLLLFGLVLMLTTGPDTALFTSWVVFTFVIYSGATITYATLLRKPKTLEQLGMYPQYKE